MKVLEKGSSVHKVQTCDVVLAFCSCKKQSAGLSSTAEALEKTRADLEKCLSAAQEEHQKNSSQLHSLLEQSKTRTKELQKEVKAALVPYSEPPSHIHRKCYFPKGIAVS